jgi:hypothetical protein
MIFWNNIVAIVFLYCDTNFCIIVAIVFLYCDTNFCIILAIVFLYYGNNIYIFVTVIFCIVTMLFLSHFSSTIVTKLFQSVKILNVGVDSKVY